MRKRQEQQIFPGGVISLGRASGQQKMQCKSGVRKATAGLSASEHAAASSAAVDARRESGKTQTQVGRSAASTEKGGGVWQSTSVAMRCCGRGPALRKLIGQIWCRGWKKWSFSAEAW